MKKIKIQHFTLPDKQSVYTDRKKNYKVHLGNGYIASYSNRNDVTAFLADCNCFLNQKLQEHSFLFVETFKLYQQAWFYMDKTKKIEFNHFKTINEAFDLATSRSHFTNGNHFVFSHLNNINKVLTDILTDLKEVFDLRNFTSNKHVAVYLIKQLTDLKEDVANYPNHNEKLKEKINEIIKQL
ncbi:MAG: hypothetical protein K0B10_07115 [Vicingaceae bacterium]|nr:hypothetical protein [Vicingaceae bacterium]